MRHIGQFVFEFDCEVRALAACAPCTTNGTGSKRSPGSLSRSVSQTPAVDRSPLQSRRFSADELQKLMRHKSYLTTKGMDSLGQKMSATAPKVFVPTGLTQPRAVEPFL